MAFKVWVFGELTAEAEAYEGSGASFDLIAAADVFGYAACWHLTHLERHGSCWHAPEVTDLSAVFRLVLQNLSPERGWGWQTLGTWTLKIVE